MWHRTFVRGGLALGMLVCSSAGALDPSSQSPKPAAAECKTLPHGSLRASLDRSVIARPNSPNRMLKGTLKWSGEADGGFEGLFVGAWDTTRTSWSGKTSWSHPAGQGGFTAELDLGDKGSPLFVSGRHLISVLDEDCKAQAFYELKIHPEAAARLIKAKTATVRLTGLTESPSEPLPGSSGN
jgi:hypothetical protein